MERRLRRIMRGGPPADLAPRSVVARPRPARLEARGEGRAEERLGVVVLRPESIPGGILHPQLAGEDDAGEEVEGRLPADVPGRADEHRQPPLLPDAVRHRPAVAQAKAQAAPRRADAELPVVVEP